MQHTKPKLHNGYEIREGLSVIRRVEKIFFTEVYLLSDKSYFYFFLNLDPKDTIGGSKKFDIVNLEVRGGRFVGIITKEHSMEHVAKIFEVLTQRRGLDKVAGMRELKTLLVQDIIKPLLNPEEYERFKISLPNGILLYGPPGVGKTFIVRQLAEELDYNFIEVNHSDVASSYIHGTVSKIAKIFEMAKTKSPSIIFIDEIEGLIPDRDMAGAGAEHKREEVNEFLTRLNDAGKDGILVVGATNRPDLLDRAALRAGRMDRKIYVPPPDFEARRELFKLFLSGRPCEKNIDFDGLAEKTDKFISADIELIVADVARFAVESGIPEITEEILLHMIDKAKPSVTEEEIRKLERYSRGESETIL